MESIRNIVFDLGGVLLNYDTARDTHALRGIGLPEYAEWSHRPGLSALIEDYYAGMISEGDFCEQVRPFFDADGLLRPAVSDAAIIEALQAVYADIPTERLEKVKALREHHHVYLLSNINRRGWDYALEQFAKAGVEPDDCFDGLYLSFRLGIKKPDIAIYQRVASDAGLVPQETLLIDDSPENLRGAERAGWKGSLAKLF